MRILHVAASLGFNSAAGRLCIALQREGADVLALGEETQGFVDGACFPKSPQLERWRVRVGQLLLHLHPTRDKTMPWSSPLLGHSLVPWIGQLKPDIVHLHWIACSTVNLRSLAQLAVPVVWTFHDVWALTAGCHCQMACEKWRLGCRACPQLGDGFAGADVSSLLWRYKRHAYKQAAELHAILPSRWLASMAMQSPLWQGHRVHHLGNALDTTLFSPQDKGLCRKLWGLPEDKPVLLFGATSTNIPYKGFALLQQALERLKAQGKDLHLVVFGEHSGDGGFPYPATFVGFVNEPCRLASLYSTADVFVAPSKQDNLPTTCLEASACETSCVAFDVGGISDIVLHNESGYLASPFDIEDLAHGINLVLESPSRADAWGRRARQHIIENFESSLIACQHMELYSEILQKGWA